MDIEQYGNSSHHFILNVPNNQRQQQTRQNNFLRKIERVPMTNEGSTITAKTAGWQIVQDMTKNILSRQTTKPTFKPSNIIIFDFSDSIVYVEHLFCVI